MSIAITGATGQLGQLVIELLLQSTPASSLIAVVRDPTKAANFAAKGVHVRPGDYSNPASLEAAFQGVERLLLISSNDLGGQRAAQHANAVSAAQRQGVKLIVYTSLLRANTTPIKLAKDHFATEQIIASSGIPHVFLRNGWYIENYASSIAAALQHGALIGSASGGLISAASRTDYAEAAAKILTGPLHPEKVIYELAGDRAFSLSDLAAEISRASGRTIPYANLTAEEYGAALRSAGLPDALVDIFVDADAGISQGALHDDHKELSTLIGRPATPLASYIAQVAKV